MRSLRALTPSEPEWDLGTERHSTVPIPSTVYYSWNTSGKRWVERRRGRLEREAWLKYLIELGFSCPQNQASGSLEQSARKAEDMGTEWGGLEDPRGRRQGAASGMQQGQQAHAWWEWGYECIWG